MLTIKILELTKTCLDIAIANKQSLHKELGYFSNLPNLNQKVFQAKILQNARANMLVEELACLSFELQQSLPKYDKKINELQTVCLTHALRLIEVANTPLKTLDIVELLNVEDTPLKIATKPKFTIEYLKKLAQSNIKLTLT